MTTFFLWLNDQQAGPFTVAQLRGMWHSGSITSQNLYWQEGMPEWVPLSGLASILDEQPVQSVAVTEIRPKSGNVTVVGIIGILIGAFCIVFAAPAIPTARNLAEGQAAVGLLMFGVFISVGCYFWARDK